MTDKTYEKYKLVIDEYFVNGFNGVKAYKNFYPNAKDSTADTSFRKILEIPRIEKYFSKKQETSRKALQTSHNVLLEELRAWAYSDITQTLTLTPEQIKELPDQVRRLITKYETKTQTYTTEDSIITETVTKLWFVSKERAMEMIHKHTGFYEKDNTQRKSEMETMSREDRNKRIEELYAKHRSGKAQSK